MKLKEIYDIAVPPKKRNEEKYNLWVNFVVRPLSVFFTKPFIRMKIKPINVTAVSILCSAVGFFLMSCGNSLGMRVAGWCLFFVWGVLDGVDGNLARCTNQCSQLGDLWDTVGGYAAMVFIYFSVGIAAYFDNNRFVFCAPYLLIILGGATAIFSIFPRLVMQKKKAYGGTDESVKFLSDKKSFGFTQIFAMNIISPTGFIQLLLLFCIIFHLLNLFILFYSFVNFFVMMITLSKLLRA